MKFEMTPCSKHVQLNRAPCNTLHAKRTDFFQKTFPIGLECFVNVITSMPGLMVHSEKLAYNFEQERDETA